MGHDRSRRLQGRLLVLSAAAVACGRPTPLYHGPREPSHPESVVADSLRVEWPVYSGELGGTRYSRLTQIDRVSVRRLRLAWSWATRERPRLSFLGAILAEPGSFQASPVMLHDTLYLATPLNRAVALNAETGRELWSFDPRVHRRPVPKQSGPFVHRGVAVWTGRTERRVFLNTRWRLIALDASTGRPVPTFGEGGEVDLTTGLPWPVNRLHFGSTSPPVIYQTLVIVGSRISDRLVYPGDPPGAVQALDVLTGSRVWSWSPIPRRGEPGWDTWKNGSAEYTGHANVWAPMTVDSANGLLFLPVSTPSNDWFGGARKGANLFAESLVCIDARTGRRVWHFQIVHHGLWDYDPAAPPVLLTLRQGGRTVEAVALAAKTGFVYVFERLTGTPIWPIEERPVPASDVPGEEAFPTQPFPTRPPAFAKQGFSATDVVDFTPHLREQALERLGGSRTGPLFTPPSLRGTVVMPGWLGGAGWGATAADPTKGILYVKATNLPSLGKLIAVPTDDPRMGRFTLDPTAPPDRPLRLPLTGGHSPDASLDETNTVPINKPPYGTLTAYDLNDGTIRWQVVVGDLPQVRADPRFRALALPRLGVAGAPGPTLTASGLLFLTGGGSVLYALDTADGRILWEYDLGERGYANPVVYRTSSGAAFVIIATGLGEGARLMAFSLAPEPSQ